MKYPHQEQFNIRLSEGERERIDLLSAFYGVKASAIIIASIDEEFKKVAKEAGFKGKVKTQENKRFLKDL